MRIAVIAPASPHGFFDPIWKGIWSAACDLSPFRVKVESFETEGHDLSAQRRLLGAIPDSPPDALVIVPAHHSRLDEEIARVEALGIPVVTFHADAPASGRHVHVGTDPVQSGALAGELLAKMIGPATGPLTLASFPGSFETEHLSQRYIAFRGELKKRAPEIRETVCHLGFDDLEQAADRAFSNGNGFAGIYVGSSRAYAVAQAMERWGIHAPCIGFDNTPETRPFLARGTVSAVIDESPYLQGYLAIQNAFEAVEGFASADARSNNEKLKLVRIPSNFVFSATASGPERCENSEPMASLVRLRTQKAARSQKLADDITTRLTTLADTDPLTGVSNRQRFERALAARSQDHATLSIVMVGLNGLSRFGRLQEDGRLGHQVDDEAICRIAKLLETHCRTQDVCARLAGDEFGLLLPGACRAHANQVKERVLASIAKIVIAPRTLNLGLHVTAGVATMPNDATNPEDLLVCADQSLYAGRRPSVKMAFRQLTSALSGNATSRLFG